MENQSWHYTPAGVRMDYVEFSPGFIETLEDPLDYFFTRYQLLEYIGYFRDNNIDIACIKILQEDNIRNLPMDPLDQYDIIQLGQMLREHDVAG
jgi:hypothetical protein